jgi:hypothetical protein
MNKRYVVRLTDEERQQLSEMVSQGQSGRLQNQACPHSPEGRCGWSRMDRRAGGRGLRLPCEDSPQRTAAAGRRGARGGLGTQEAGPTVAGTHLRWRGGSQTHCPAVQRGSRRISPLDATAAGRQSGRVGDRARHLARDSQTGAQKVELPASALDNELKPHLKEQYVIPPQQSAEFVAHMEDVLEVYHRSYDPRRPVVCMDEQPVQLIKTDPHASARRARPTFL